MPSGLSATPGYRSAALRWTASSDNVAVAGYEVARATGATATYTSLGTTTTTSFSSNGLKTGRTYSFEVRAYDAAGNYSAYSAPVSVIAQ